MRSIFIYNHSLFGILIGGYTEDGYYKWLDKQSGKFYRYDFSPLDCFKTMREAIQWIKKRFKVVETTHLPIVHHGIRNLG